MSSHVTFLLLGLGSGAVIASLGLGVVVAYRASGIVNFSHAAIGMFVAFAYYELRATGDLVLPVIGMPSRFHLLDRPTVATALAVALVYAALIGAALYWLVFHHLRDATPLAGLVATLGIMLYLIAVAGLRFAGQGASVLVLEGPLPTRIVRWFGVTTPIDRYLLAASVVVVAAALWVYFARTHLGLATRAAAENRRGAVLVGLAPGRIGTVNWMIACVLAGAAVIAAAPIVRLDPATTALLIVPALAAAVPGRFDSIWSTVAFGLFLGMAQSEILNLQTDVDWLPEIGLQQGIPFLVIIASLALRGDIIPSRGVTTTSYPASPDHRHARTIAVGLSLASVVALFTVGPTWRLGIVVSSIAAIFAVSVVVLSGYIGQLSLQTFALAGVAAFATVRLTEDAGIPFPLAPLLGATAATAVGVATGVAALRTRGMTLAIATLAAAVAIEELLFRWTWLTGGLVGASVRPPELFGLDLRISAPGDAFPREAFGVMVAVVLCVTLLAAINLRRGATGRRWLAVRSNERAAAGVGISVRRAKLESFMLAGFIAGIGGTLLAYRRELVTADSFGVLDSIVVLSITFLAGIASPLGAVIAGALGAGGLLTVGMETLRPGSSDTQFAINGILLVVAAIRFRDGILGTAARRRPRRVADRLRQPGGAADATL